jgi:iron complex outermembrane receptor protein
MSIYRLSSIVTMLTLAGIGGAHAQQIEEEDLALAYGDKSFLSIATGASQPVARAPSVATVITAEDIRAIGARDLDEVLETVPGLHVSRSTLANTPIYVIRGIHRNTNPQVLVLINGIPVTSIFEGNRGDVWGGLPVDNIGRIEVIRGPGSALYGADAFAGVINIITKSAGEIGGTQLGARGGSFDTKDAWILNGAKWGDFDVALYLGGGSTDGAKSTVSADAQTGWDGVFGACCGAPPVSHAPGPINNGRDLLDGQLDLTRNKYRFRIGYQERENVGSGVGVAQALDPTGKSYSERITSDLTYHDESFAKDWDLTVQANYLHYKEFSDLTLFPAGAFGGAFTDGMIGNPYKWERHYGVEASAFYTGVESHRIRTGVGYSKREIYRVRETKNFNPDFTPIGSGSQDDVTDVSDTVPFLRPHSRNAVYLYAQDEWNFVKDWTLTAGIRHDDYSDFGGTTNPRAALVWEAAYNVTAKLLYGTAFRAPAFTELYNINNPVQVGNPNLKPEKIRTLEAAVSWEPEPALKLNANVFRYEMRDMIRFVATTAQNTGEQTGSGLELEATWDALKEWRLSGNYSYQRSIDEATNQDAGNAPHHHAYLRSDWRFTPGWMLTAQLNAVGERRRVAGDTRPDLDGYETVDLTLSTRGARKQWDIALSVRNLFDVDASEPSPFDMSAAQPFISIPDDIPLPGRWYLLQARYQL